MGKFPHEVEEELAIEDLMEWDAWFKLQHEAREKEANRIKNRRP